jgi:hypothetical protein
MPRTTRFLFVLAVLLVLTTAAAVRVHAIERGPLPALTLSGIDGAPVASSGIVKEGNWLIVYVQPDCRACESILGAATHEKHPGLPDRLVVVVGGASSKELRALADRFPGLPAGAWHADPDRAMFDRLRLTGVPVVVGLRGSMIEWGLSGVLPDAAAVESVLASWIAQ